MIQKFNPIRLFFAIMLLGALAWGCGEAEQAEEAAPQEEVVTPEPIVEEPVDTTTVVDSTAEQRPVNRN